MALYAVGDIHGNLAQLHRALRLIESDGGAEARVIFLGDYVDRGADSRGVLQTLIDGQAAGRDWICLKGNHDHMFQHFLEQGKIQIDPMPPERSWLHDAGGGRDTLAAYLGADHPALIALANDPKPGHPSPKVLDPLFAAARKAVPPSHLSFLQNLPLSHSETDLFFAHAGIRPGTPLCDQTETDLIWIREPFLSDPRNHGPLIVHGHTVQQRPIHHGNRINLDGGAGYGRLLIPAVFDKGTCHIPTEKGRWPLTP